MDNKLNINADASIATNFVLPQFTGRWYAGRDIFLDYDPCSYPIIKYLNATFDPISMAKELFNEITDHQWDPQFNYMQDLKQHRCPNDFKGKFSSELWNKIFVDNPEATGINYIHFTIEDGRYAGHIEMTPIYACPPNSNYGWTSSLGGICTTTIHVCNADIVGRDLDFPGIGYLGHVGLTYENQYVLEVLNEPGNVLQKNSLAKFKTITPFWGANYLSQTPLGPLDRSDALSILFYGELQKNYNVEYTMRKKWRAGSYSFISAYDPIQNQTKKFYALKNAIFRCDTFVNYAYDVARKIHLPTTNTILPKNTFASLPFNRVNQLEMLANIPQPIPVNRLETKYENYISSIYIDRINKIDTLWQEALESQEDTDKFGFVIDYLTQLSPIEISDTIIEAFHHSNILHNKLKLLSLLRETLVSNLIITEQKHVQTNHAEKIANLFLQQIKNSEHPLIINHALWSLQAISPNSVTFDMINETIAKLPSSMQETPERHMLQLGYAFNSKSQQKEILTLVDNAAIKTANSQNQFNTALLSLLAQVESDHIHPTLKQPLLTYLHKHQLSLKHHHDTRFDIACMKLAQPHSLNQIKLLSQDGLDFPSAAATPFSTYVIAQLIDSAAHFLKKYHGNFHQNHKSQDVVTSASMTYFNRKINHTSMHTTSNPSVCTAIQKLNGHVALWQTGYEMLNLVKKWWTNASLKENLENLQAEQARIKQYEFLKTNYKHKEYAAIYFKVFNISDTLTVQEMEENINSLTTKERSQLIDLATQSHEQATLALLDYPPDLSSEIISLADHVSSISKHKQLSSSNKQPSVSLFPNSLWSLPERSTPPTQPQLCTRDSYIWHSFRK